MSDDDFERTVRYWRELQERLSTSRHDFPWGTAYLDAEFPLMYDANHLWIEDPAPAATTDDLATEADRILGGAGLAHRKVMVAREDDGAPWSMGFGERGYRISRLLTMAVGPDPGEEVDTSAVEVVDFDDARAAIETANAREPYATSAEVVRQLTDYHGKLERELDCRFYVVRVDGEVAAFCELYGLGSIAQVEDVNTLEEHRGRGFAKAVVSAAVRDARSDGAELIFLYADAHDWPQHLYGKLGFRPLGYSLEFILEAMPGIDATA
ncbi:MAG TPA: GNAT family N-acetyltransferase [Actinomycetota bacterium]